jgi:arginyl-tRNA synthetase
MPLVEEIGGRCTAALAAAGVDTSLPHRPQWTGKPQFGDLQLNVALAAAKSLGRNPRELAQAIVDNLDIEGLAERVEIAGPGFINIFLGSEQLANEIVSLSAVKAYSGEPDRVVVDYSSPNLAKEMHVGHLRSTIIGDAVVRCLEYLGHQVIRQNHVGDWGTQFGMLIAELEDVEQEGQRGELALADLEIFYRQAKAHFDEDAGFADRARQYVVKLQSGDQHCLELWQKFIDLSMQHAEEIYQTLNVSLQPEDTKGESAYNEALPGVVEELVKLGLAREDQGAKLVYLDSVVDGEGNPLPLMIQKTDGGYLYGTTDLAALRYRVDDLKANRCLYFSDARQALHMKQVFATARAAGWVSDEVDLLHCTFGTMLGEDGKPFKTRSGGTIKLIDLLNESVMRARALVEQKNPDLGNSEKDEIARAVGIGAVKYADLCRTRTHDYSFSFEQMLSFEGNTAPYLQYAFARICSLFRKAGVDRDAVTTLPEVSADAERQLAIWLIRFDEIVRQVAERGYPHELCSYLYQLASLFMSFYEHCPILRDGVSPEQRDGRLALAAASATTLARGLDLLGIDALERM